MAATPWETGWEVIEGIPSKGGGQGTVVQVRRKTSGELGALKLMHPSQHSDSTRRFRMKREADALRFMNGRGTPELLDTNADDYEETEVPLYAVTRWVPGPTLFGFVTEEKRLALDTASLIVEAIAETVLVFHSVGIHRDLKPDNIILENGDSKRPVVVDFGMSSIAGDELITAAGEELGNRFLRLPEFSANRHRWDSRSDITFLVGLLFYMVVGRFPRLLVDAQGTAPHESLSAVELEVLESTGCWSRLRRLFQVGFQQMLDRRFQSVESFLSALSGVSATASPADSLDDEIRETRELYDSDIAKELEQFRAAMMLANRSFLEGVEEPLREAGLVLGGDGPTPEPSGRAVSLRRRATPVTASYPDVGFSHSSSVRSNQFVSEYHVEAGDPVVYFRGPVADCQRPSNFPPGWPAKNPPRGC
ncbi:MAG: protein kinase domain-containing protein [Thermoanaerobaculia bacterium]